MPVQLTLVHSPLVAPATWETLAPAVQRRGYQVAVPDLTPTLAAGPPFALPQIDLVAASAGRNPTVLVGHSGAGPLLAAAAEASDGVVEGCVFVDAGLPTPGRSWFEVVPPELATAVRGLARDGWLPPWSQWWGPDELSELLPQRPLREQFAAGCPPVPVAMFEEALPPSPGWIERPGAYLRLSGAYHDASQQARALGWPVIELDADHLSVLSRAELVVDPLLDLVARIRR